MSDACYNVWCKVILVGALYNISSPLAQGSQPKESTHLSILQRNLKCHLASSPVLRTFQQLPSCCATKEHNFPSLPSPKSEGCRVN